jgi:F0F1-type ATP synthase membrane subunit b/b'
VNLFIFAAALVYLLKPRLAKAFKERKATIQQTLAQAQAERDEALARLAEVEARLARLDQEVAAIQENSKLEAQAERDRIAREAEQDSLKLREQAQRDISGAVKVAKHELRVFAAQQSVQLAEELIRRDINADDDSKLIKLNVEQLGRART